MNATSLAKILRGAFLSQPIHFSWGLLAVTGDRCRDGASQAKVQARTGALHP